MKKEKDFWRPLCAGKAGSFRQVGSRSKTCLRYCSRCCGGYVRLKVEVWCFRGGMPLAVVNINPGRPQADTQLDICVIQEKWKNRLVGLVPLSFLSLYPNVMWIYGKKLENVVGRSKIRVRCASIRADAFTGPEPERRVQQTRQWEPDCIIVIE